LKALGATLPAALDETLLTTLLLLVIGPALSLCDDHVVKVTQKKIHKQTSSTRDQPADAARPSLKADSNPMAFVDDLGKGVVDVIDGLGKNIQELGAYCPPTAQICGRQTEARGRQKVGLRHGLLQFVRLAALMLEHVNLMLEHVSLMLEHVNLMCARRSESFE